MDRSTGFQTEIALQIQKTELELTKITEKVDTHSDILKDSMRESRERNERHLEILAKISVQVDHTQKCLDMLDQKVDLSVKKLESEIIAINKLDEQQNKILEEHIAGVNTLKQMHELQKKEVAARLAELEKPGEWLKMTRKGILWLGGIAAALAAILKLIGAF